MEAWWGTCPCYDDELPIDSTKLAEAGVVFTPPAPPPTPPTFGATCVSDSECDSTLRCSRSTATGLYHCTQSCEEPMDCPADSFCNGGSCDWLVESP